MTIFQNTDKLYSVKTTFDIADPLLARAKRHARRTGQPLRALVEEGLERVLSAESEPVAYRLPDRSVGNPRSPDPLAELAWPDLRDVIYGGR